MSRLRDFEITVISPHGSFRPQSFRPNQNSLRSIIEVSSPHTRVISLQTEVTSLHVSNLLNLS